MDDTLDDVWKALADPTRRALLDTLRHGPRTTGDLAQQLPALSRFAVMKHLGVLEQAGLITVRREGRKRYNALNAVPLRQLYERWVSTYEDRWAGSLLSLKQSLERKEHDMPVKTIDQAPRIAEVQCEIVINAPRQKVWDAFINEPNNWFYPDHDRAAKSTHLEPFLGGKMYLRDEVGDKAGDENLMAIVTLLRPGRKIRLKGDFTMPLAMVANATISFEDAPGEGEGSGGATRVHVDHRMLGEFGDEDPAGFQEGWLDGLQKLKALVEA